MSTENIKSTKSAFKAFYYFLAQDKKCVKEVKKNDRKFLKEKLKMISIKNWL